MGGSAYTKQTVFVNKGGDDSTADGTYEGAFLTIGAALASITDSGTAKRYAVVVGPGNYTEAGFVLKPYVHIKGAGLHTRLTLTSNITLLGGVWNTTTARTGLFDMLLSGSGGNGLTLDLQTAGNTTGSTLSCVVEMGNVHVNGAVVWSARTTADTLEIWQCQFLGAVTIHGGAVFFKNNYLPVTVTADTASAGDNNTAMNFENNTVDQLVVSSSLPAKISFTGGTIYTSLSVSNATTTFTTDLLPPTTTIASAPTVVLSNTAQAVAYTPGTPGDWAVAPTTVFEAIERLAAKVYAAGTSGAI